MPYFSMKQGELFPSFTLGEKEKAKIMRFLAVLDDSGLDKIVSQTPKSASAEGGRPGYERRSMLPTVLYGFAFGCETLRDLESACRFDLRYKFLMDGEEPSHMSFARFVQDVITPNRDAVFSILTKAIFKECGLSHETVYVDGTKQEADANKYKFVWRPDSAMARLSDKARALLSSLGMGRGVPLDGAVTSKILASKVTEAEALLRESGEDPASLFKARGHRNTRLAKGYMELSSYLVKTLEYEERTEICGPRGSYYKTDHDATAMCLKEDYYSGLGSNMHAAYSAQIAVSHGLVVCYYVGQERSDAVALIPLMERVKRMAGGVENVVADAGYGTLDNYRYLKGNGMRAFVKYPEWEGELSGRRPAAYSRSGGAIVCTDGRELSKTAQIGRHPKRQGASFYTCGDCSGCRFMHYCRRFNKDDEADQKTFEIVEEWLDLKEEARDLLLSAEGIEMRVNRSCQVEGTFGVIKQDMGYDRFRRTGLERVSTEFMLYCLGLNIRKLFRHFDGKAKFNYWTAPEGMNPEKFRNPSAKRIENRVRKSKERKMQPNEQAKKGYKRKKRRNNATADG